ncbi:MAG: pyridoxal 5'-phosphate synthase glutaminase subunit PdxT [Chloroflexi bacterium]|nr:pyridoxal 5'-phosphate synthase glutaminase subunit PdxT [Chloroflexota bacterium]
MTRIGVLALQGAFQEHIETLKKIGVEAVEVRLPEDLDGLDGLVIPGGESTTIGKLMVEYNFLDSIKKRAQNGFAILGTCAGMILLANGIPGFDQPTIGILDIDVKRNAFGRQVDSFEVDIPIPELGEKYFRAVFIRAPVIGRTGPDVKVLAHLSDGTPVAARQGKILVCAFHPELTDDLRFHDYFLNIACSRS